MPEPVEITKAELWELDSTGNLKPDSRVVVQFNPESLKVTFANQVVPPSNNSGDTSGDQRETAALQFVGKGTTKLAVQLWFDATAPLPEGTLSGGARSTDDVRKLTQRVAYFITPQKSQDPKYSDKDIPPAVRLRWGTFQFDGIVEGMEESLEFFSPEGRPLRASVNLTLTQQKIEFAFNPDAKPAGKKSGRKNASSPGTQPLEQAKSGDSVQSLAAAKGMADDWQKIAEANGIENPRRLSPGQFINFNVSLSA
jgi:hypothetical protein